MVDASQLRGPGRNFKHYNAALSLLARPEGISTLELAGSLGITRQSAHKLIRSIEDMGVILEPTSRPNVRWKLDMSVGNRALGKFEVPSPSLAKSIEAGALVMMRRCITGLAGTRLESSLHSALNKVILSLPAELTKRMGRYSAIFVTKATGQFPLAEGIADNLLAAMLENTQVLINLLYETGNASNGRLIKINPLHFFAKGERLFLLFQDSEQMWIDFLPVDMILSVFRTKEEYGYPKGLKPSDYVDILFRPDNSGGEAVRIHFAKKVANEIMVGYWTFPTHQTAKKQKDGSVILEMKTTDLHSVKSWVLGFGDAAKVLGPPQLAKDIAATANEMAKLYI